MRDKEVERCPTKTAISAISPKIAKFLSMISMYEINVMVLLHRFILHGIRPIAAIVGMFSTDLYVLRRK